jgi:hypothetical protein
MKPAVRYYITPKVAGKTVKKIVYEHREEPPASWNLFKGKKVPRYRRCYTGVIRDGLPFLEEKEEKLAAIEGTTEQIVKEETKELDYKKIFQDHLHEINEIAFDISGEEAKRILKNLWRYLNEQRQELRRENG